jgi:hypothetical protein
MLRTFRGLFAAALMLVLAMPMHALAWGGRGHRLIGELAYARFTPEARAMIAQLIAFAPEQEGAALCSVTSFADISTWADCVRGNEIANYAYMSELHYVNRSVHGPAPTGSFCAAGNCVTEAVRRASLVLADRSAPGLVRLLALEQLAHFLEDMHQPLHVGDNGDRGGNDVAVIPFGEGRAHNLHSLWDGDLVTAAVGENSERVGLVRDLMTEHAAQWQGQTIEQWALESWLISRDCSYRLLATPPGAGQSPADGGQIGHAYVEYGAPIVREQLAKAAVRLAEAINHAAAASILNARPEPVRTPN